ncbi:hypothetical protein C356_02538 [Cryptococcus neoformans c45]|nr:hypothetical protein C356_02538 [Cryptococcus neoformans var. grubii c45]
MRKVKREMENHTEQKEQVPGISFKPQQQPISSSIIVRSAQSSRPAAQGAS